MCRNYLPKIEHYIHLSHSVLVYTYTYISHFSLVVVIYTVSFNQMIYSATEDSMVAQVTLVLDNPPSTDINIEVITTDGSAIGEYKI